MFPLFLSVAVHLMVHLCMNEMHFVDFLAVQQLYLNKNIIIQVYLDASIMRTPSVDKFHCG